MRTKKLTKLAIITTVSLIMFMIESLFPPLFVLAPYVKLGLSNIFTLLVLVLYGGKDAFFVMLIRNVLGTILTGAYFAFPFNIAGSFASMLTMYLLWKFAFPKLSILTISIMGAIVSNIARTSVAVILMKTVGLYLQLPFVIIISVLAGIIIGLAVYYIIKYINIKFLK